MTISLTRRGFLGGAGATGLATTLPLSVLADFAGAAPPNPDQGILMVVFLRGGNDSINTVGPFDNGIYRDNRLSLAVSPHGHLSAGSGLYYHLRSGTCASDSARAMWRWSRASTSPTTTTATSRRPPRG